MATTSFATILQQFKRVCPQCDDAHAKLILNRVHDRIGSEFSLKTYTGTVNVVANTQAVTLANALSETYTIKKVDRVRYQYLRDTTNANTVTNIVLTPVTLQELDDMEENWEDQIGTPRRFFLKPEGNLFRIGLVPTPNSNTNTTAGYPYPRIQYRVRVDDSEPLGDNPSGEMVPPILLNGDVYIWGMAEQFFSEREPERAGYYRQKYLEELQRNRRHVFSMAAGLNPKISPTVARHGRTVV